jgi:hypothetical protein
VVGDGSPEREADEEWASSLPAPQRDEGAKKEVRPPNLGVVSVTNEERTTCEE